MTDLFVYRWCYYNVIVKDGEIVLIWEVSCMGWVVYYLLSVAVCGYQIQ